MATSTDVFCGPCEAQDITKPADHWCPECEEGLCNDCHRHHSFSKATRGHAILSVENFKKLPTTISEVVHHCKEHSMKHQNYCPKHDEICCPVCISTNHKKCTDLMAISELIKTSKTSSLLASIEENLQDIKARVNNVTKNRHENLSRLKDQRQKYADEVKQIRIKINSHLDILEEKIMNELVAAENEASEKIENVLTQISKTGNEVEELQTSVLAVKEYASDLQTFFGSKTMEEEVDKIEKDMKSLQEGGSLQELDLKFIVDEKVSNFLMVLTKFGSVSVTASPSAVVVKAGREKQAQIMTIIQQPAPKTIHDVKVSLVSKFEIPEDNYNNDVRGCVCLPNGKFVFTDCSMNRRLIIMNSDFSFDKAIHLPEKQPHDVTSIGGTHVAVATSGGIEVINLNSADNPVKRITMAGVNCGVTSHKGKILWCEKSIGIREVDADKSCNVVTTLVHGVDIPNWAYITACDDNIYITNPTKSTVTCYQNNKKLWDFTNGTVFRDPEGVTVDSDHYVYISSFNDSKVALISPDGKQVRILLTKKDGIDKPWGIYFDQVKSSLIVVNRRGTVFVYKIS